MLHSICFTLLFHHLIRYIYTKICSLVWLLKVFLFVNSKCKRYFHNRLKPSKLTWTAMYRKQHKKVIWCFGTDWFLRFVMPLLRPWLVVLAFWCTSYWFICCFLFWCFLGHCCWICEEEAPRRPEALFKVHCWCHLGSHTKKTGWEARSQRCCTWSCSPV